jgi:rod shape-determining protein MreD
MILLLVMAVENGKTAGIWGGFFAGLFIDVFSVGLLGVNALAKTIVGAAAGLMERKNILISPVILLVLLIVACIVNDLIIYIPTVYSAGENLSDLPKYLFLSSFPRAVYTAFVAAVILVIWENFIPSKRR